MIEADLSRQEINPPQQNIASPPSPDPNEIDSQIEVIRSANVLLPVVKQLKLDEEDPQFSRSLGLLRWLFGPPHVDEQAQAATALEALDKSSGCEAAWQDACDRTGIQSSNSHPCIGHRERHCKLILTRPTPDKV